MNIALQQGVKLSVLLVDDEPQIRETLRNFLEVSELFAFIVEAQNGQEAYTKCQNQDFDFIVSDLMMPKISGIELIQNIRAMEKRKNQKTATPFIILSANITGEEIQTALSMGVKYILTKPCTLNDFTQKVAEVLIKEKRNKIKILKG